MEQVLNLSVYLCGISYSYLFVLFVRRLWQWLDSWLNRIMVLNSRIKMVVVLLNLFCFYVIVFLSLQLMLFVLMNLRIVEVWMLILKCSSVYDRQFGVICGIMFSVICCSYVVLIDCRFLIGFRLVFLFIFENSLFSVLQVCRVIVIIVGIGLFFRIKISISVIIILGKVCRIFMIWWNIGISVG